MKTLYSTLLALMVLAGLGSAQDMSGVSFRAQSATSSPGSAHDVTGFISPYTVGPGLTGEQIKTPPNPHPNLKPRVGGIFAEGAKYGPVMISPVAPMEFGMGEKYLSAPSQTQDLQHESGKAAHRDAGGLKLFTFEF